MPNADRIEKQIILKAPRTRVWRAITDYKEFGTWFKAKLETPFVVGKWSHGMITYPGYEHLRIDVLVERMEPESVFALRWHPNAVDPGKDFSKEPTTLVEFLLDEVPEGTRLRLIESGWENIPPDRRAEAFRSNNGGWTEQMTNIEAHLAS